MVSPRGKGRGTTGDDSPNSHCAKRCERQTVTPPRMIHKNQIGKPHLEVLASTQDFAVNYDGHEPFVVVLRKKPPIEGSE